MISPSVRAVTVVGILAIFAANADSQGAPPAAPSSAPAASPATQACAQTDTCKATSDAASAAASANTAADGARAAATRADQSASGVNGAMQAATKAAEDANAASDTATKRIAALNAAAGLRSRRAKAKKPLGDFVPCLFDDGQNYELRALAAAVASVAQASFNQAAPSGDPGQPVRDFAMTLTADKFLNVMPSDVSAVVQDLANKAPVPLSPASVTPASVAPAAASPAQNAADQLAGPTTFERPDDVSCSFSILQWKETSDTFGRRVANDYVALQVTVRNLNSQNEFLIHDIQIAVDTGLNRLQFGRFQAARDKLIVRNVAQRGQTEDRRNVIINVLQAVGAIAGGASGALLQSTSSSTAQATDLGAAVAIFQGPFITGLINIFPDHTLEHLNHINDLAFSASSTSKTVVPIQGAAPLVTFLAEKPLEQLPFARCGTSTKPRPTDPDKPEPGASQYSFCNIGTDNPYNPPSSDDLQPGYYMRPYPFRNWRAAALAVLERRVFVVISGVHIKEVAKQPTFSGITCAPANNTTIDLSKISDPSATCSLKGTDLDLIGQLVLESPTDATDQAKGSASVTAGDTTQATATFATKDLIALRGTAYKVSYSLKGGTPQPTTLTVTVKPVLSLSSNPLAFGHVAAGRTLTKTVTLTNNTNESLAIAVAITPIGANAAAAAAYAVVPPNPCTAVAASGNCTISVTFTAPAVAPPAPGTFPASLTMTRTGQVSPQSIDLTATVP